MDFNLSIAPAQAEYLIKPGSTIVQAYTVINNSQNNLILNTSVEPWTPRDSDGGVSYQNVATNPELTFSLSNSDLKLGQSFILKPNEKRQLVLKINSTATLPQTDSYYTFFVTQDQSGSLGSSENQTLTQAKIGSHLLLSYSSTENYPESATIETFSSSPFFKDTFFPAINFSGELTNTSVHFFKTDGKITVTKGDKIIKEFKLFPHNLLPNSPRQFSCLQDQDLVPCQISPPFWPGLYTAKLEMNSPIKTTPVSINFYVFPYTIIFSLAIITLLSLSLIRHFQKKYSSASSIDTPPSKTYL